MRAESTRKEVPKEIPTRLPNKQNTSLGESARQFARGFWQGVRDETAHMYRDAIELPQRVATTGASFSKTSKRAGSCGPRAD